jgi:tRNA-(ms[2]io[6]A)-hydroxylase
MIEARSCERFVLSENIKDPELAKFYRDLMISEAGH